MSDENAQNVLTLELAADRWVQKDDHWYWFKANGIMVHSEWLSYMGHWYYGYILPPLSSHFKCWLSGGSM